MTNETGILLNKVVSNRMITDYVMLNSSST